MNSPTPTVNEETSAARRRNPASKIPPAGRPDVQSNAPQSSSYPDRTARRATPRPPALDASTDGMTGKPPGAVGLDPIPRLPLAVLRESQQERYEFLLRAARKENATFVGRCRRAGRQAFDGVHGRFWYRVGKLFRPVPRREHDLRISVMTWAAPFAAWVVGTLIVAKRGGRPFRRRWA